MTRDPVPQQLVLKMTHVLETEGDYGLVHVRSHEVTRTVNRPRSGSRTETLPCGFCRRPGNFVVHGEDSTARTRRRETRQHRVVAAGLLVVILACWGLGLFADITGFLVAAIMLTLIGGPVAIGLGLTKGSNVGVESPAQITFDKREDWAGAGFRSKGTARVEGTGLSCYGSAQEV